MRRFAFVDWDDTLKVTNALYDQASEANAKEICEFFSPVILCTKQLRRRAHVLDLAKAEAVGLKPTHYPEAWVELFQELAQQNGTQACPRVADSLYKRAEGVAHAHQEDYPGARALLQCLQNDGWEVTIWTAGDTEIQSAKVERSGYKRLIDRLCVVPEKNVASLRKALGPRDSSRVCVIGNSPRSDIVPALSVGAWAFHVQHPVWEYDEAPIDTQHPRYVAIASLREIPAQLAAVMTAH